VEHIIIDFRQSWQIYDIENGRFLTLS